MNWREGCEAMRITVRTFGHITSILGGNQIDVECSGGTIGDLLVEMASRFGSGLRSFLYPSGEGLSDLMYILVNGKNIAHLKGIDTVLKDGDIISILPITAGG
jgi:sulfur-carrier protein